MRAMNEQVTIQLSDQVARVATRLATQKRQPIEAILAGLVEAAVNDLPVETLSDEEVLALAESQMPDEQETQLSELLVRQREHQLDAESRRQLHALMQISERGMVRKAQALSEAVQRGLRQPLSA